MAYVLDGVGVEIGPQAVRPREPARPSVALTTSSPEMASRALRPRETPQVVVGTPRSTVVAAALQQVTAQRAQQTQLENLSKTLGSELTRSQAALTAANRSGSLPATSSAQVRVAAVGRSIDVTINAIRSTAERANVAAGSAIAAGATRAAVQTASAAGASASPMRASLPTLEVQRVLEAVKRVNAIPTVLVTSTGVRTLPTTPILTTNVSAGLVKSVSKEDLMRAAAIEAAKDAAARRAAEAADLERRRQAAIEAARVDAKRRALIATLPTTTSTLVVRPPFAHPSKPTLMTTMIPVKTPPPGVRPSNPFLSPPVLLPANPPGLAPAPGGETVAVESNTASISPDGSITVGPDAQLVDTPSQADQSAPGSASQADQSTPGGSASTQDVTVSSGSIGTLALVAGAIGLGYLMLRKRGKV